MGIGAFVMNEKHEVLVVQELSGPLKGKGIWKMPTGLVTQGENLHEAAPREVFEETVRAGCMGMPSALSPCRILLFYKPMYFATISCDSHMAGALSCTLSVCPSLLTHSKAVQTLPG